MLKKRAGVVLRLEAFLNVTQRLTSGAFIVCALAELTLSILYGVFFLVLDVRTIEFPSCRNSFSEGSLCGCAAYECSLPQSRSLHYPLLLDYDHYPLRGGEDSWNLDGSR
jgi:hypothetical protein